MNGLTRRMHATAGQLDNNRGHDFLRIAFKIIWFRAPEVTRQDQTRKVFSVSGRADKLCAIRRIAQQDCAIPLCSVGR